MKEKIEKLFNQQLGKINDPTLREKVVEIWADAA